MAEPGCTRSTNSPMEQAGCVRKMDFGFALGSVVLFLVGTLPGGIRICGRIFAVVSADGIQVIDVNVLFVQNNIVLIINASPALDSVRAGSAVDRAELVIVVDLIIALAAEHGGVFAALDIIIARAADDQVGPPTTAQIVVAISAVNCVAEMGIDIGAIDVGDGVCAAKT